MTEKKIYIGTHGPYYYDDADAVDDPDGDFSGEHRRGFVSQGSILVGEAPTLDSEVVRLVDLKDGAVMDGDQLDINWDPSNYTPDSSIAEADDADDLAAHLKGIDTAIGEVVESGSNSDGEWTRWADGTQICSFDFSYGFTAEADTERSSGVYTSATNSNTHFNWNYPKSFSSDPSVDASCDSILMGANCFYVDTSVSLISALGFNGQKSDNISATAIGRWF